MFPKRTPPLGFGVFVGAAIGVVYLLRWLIGH